MSRRAPRLHPRDLAADALVGDGSLQVLDQRRLAVGVLGVDQHVGMRLSLDVLAAHMRSEECEGVARRSRTGVGARTDGQHVSLTSSMQATLESVS